MKNLTDTQIQLLTLASERPDGNIEPLPDHINAGIKRRVINGLLNRLLIDKKGDGYFINQNGFDAIGLPAQETPKNEFTPRVVVQKEPRPSSKLATVVALLKREQGASLVELQEATGWQAHTVRGTLAGNLKKRFNYCIESLKNDRGERRYHISSKIINE